MREYYRHLLFLGKRLLLLMVFMSLTRLIFYLFNYSIFSILSFNQVLLHFMYGLRFDIAAVFIFNSIFIFLSIVPSNVLNKNWYQLILKFVFIGVNSLLIAVNLIDTKFYEFEGKRLTGDIFSKEWLGEDLLTVLPEFLRDYWYIFLLFIVLVYLFARLYPTFIYVVKGASKPVRFSYLKQLALAVFIMILSVFVARGGVQLKPIGIIAAARYTSPEFMALILNSPFTIIKTIHSKSLPNTEYYNLEELETIYSPVHKFDHNKQLKKRNVVIIILESFGKEYSGYLNDTVGYTPKFDSIMQLGLTFNNAYANGKRSIESLPSIFSSIPALMDNALVNTKFSSNALEGIGTILANQDYYTAFYHGGKNGTMGFDNYAKLVGIQNYFGINEYTNKEDYDGNWGVFDEPYLQYVVTEISAMPQPFFASVFTLSSHHPYRIPKKYENKFPKGELINLESIGYADYALGEFFKTASQKPWFESTLFVLTADHTAQSNHAYYKSNIGKYAVPIVFYAPGDKELVGLSEKVCQQADILPSVLDYLNYTEPFVAFGNSVFSTDTNSFAVSYLSGIYQLKYNEVIVSFDGLKIVNIDYTTVDSISFADSVYNLGATITADSIQFNDSIHIIDSIRISEKIRTDSLNVHHAEKLLKGIIQQYNFRMEHNLMKYHGKLTDYVQE